MKKISHSRYCTNYARVAWYHDVDTRRINMTRLRCKLWSCEFCAKENRATWRQFLQSRLSEIKKTSSWFLVTLTVRNCGDLTQEQSYKLFQAGFDTLMKRARRVWKNVQYVRVFEAHKSGILHMHLIMTNVSAFVEVKKRGKNGKRTFVLLHDRKSHKGTWSLQTWFKKMSVECGLGFKADVRQLDAAADAIRYVTKYMTKDLQAIKIKNLRHVQTTREIGSPAKRETSQDWTTDRKLPRTEVVADMKVFDLNAKRVVEHSFWKKNSEYPPWDD